MRALTLVLVCSLAALPPAVSAASDDTPDFQISAGTSSGGRGAAIRPGADDVAGPI
jgi:hypothetical protein